MEVLEAFVGFVVILQESLKLLYKNRKLMTFTIIVPTLLLSSLSFLIFYFCYESLLRDVLLRDSFTPITSSDSSDFATILADEDFRLMLAVDLTFVLAYSIISLFSAIATILVSAISEKGGTLFYKDLVFLVVRAWRRQYITRFYATLLVTGYIVFVCSMASPLLMFPGNSMADVLPVAILLAIAAYIWYLYLSVVLVLGIVISVIEENCHGIEALGKAARFIEGKRIQGFILNTVFSLLSVILILGVWIIRGHRWLENDLILGLFLVNFSCLISFFYFVAYTVLYFKCKKIHGKEIELEGVEYSKVSTTTPVDDMP